MFRTGAELFDILGAAKRRAIARLDSHYVRITAAPPMPIDPDYDRDFWRQIDELCAEADSLYSTAPETTPTDARPKAP